MDYQQKAEEISVLLKTINKKIHMEYHKIIDSYGITVPQMFVLRALIKEGNLPISEISKRLSLTNSTTSGIVDRLEKEGYVERNRDEKDRRIVYVCLSEKAQRMKCEIPVLGPDYFSDSMKDLGPEKIDQIIDSLTILANHQYDRD
ncbi:MAG TPA: MarR family transcriptional regulator [Candidatus Deferrimicrobium sp.]|nr:MarR family transcriptional regulator [Candidatus Deferrimicrobium sp.]